ncbi:alpha/beta hydrolase family protein [Salininema proteolyticum]|uniref:Alpha/beta hydrolase family protein n=1 Tax=Salininema proteolyticum TaxID=1607685 RepID=A0ABV8TWS4_9ACTN
MTKIIQRSMAATAALAAAAGVAAAAPAAAQTEGVPELSLAEPGGEHTVGTESLHLVDEDRADPWVPSDRRELMVSLWYPTEGRGDAAPYMTVEESEHFMRQLQEGVPEKLPGGLLAEVETNAATGTEPSGGDGELPLVVLSPGFSFPRATLTGAAEELASRGYVVAAVGHNYEAPISFPDRTTECVACAEEDYKTVVGTRTDDLSFVLDELTGEEPAWEDAEVIDSDRVVVGGHSVGGASAHRAMLEDERFDAGFNLDGTFFNLGGGKLDRPFLMVGAVEHGQPGSDKTWSKAWKRLDGWKRWISVGGSGHSSMTDLAPLYEQAGIPSPGIAGDRADDLARTYVTAFVDRHLKGEQEPVLDGPSEEWPEVRFHKGSCN